MPLLTTVFDQIDDALNYARHALEQCLPQNDNDKDASPSSSAMRVVDGAIIINGVALPPLVVDQLKQLGIALSWYSAGELEDAVEACAFDCQLIDDDDGVDFEDKLHYTEHKNEEDRGEIEAEPVRKTRHARNPVFPNFGDKIIQERQKQAQSSDDDEGNSLSHHS